MPLGPVLRMPLGPGLCEALITMYTLNPQTVCVSARLRSMTNEPHWAKIRPPVLSLSHTQTSPSCHPGHHHHLYVSLYQPCTVECGLYRPRCSVVFAAGCSGWMAVVSVLWCSAGCMGGRVIGWRQGEHIRVGHLLLILILFQATMFAVG